jgi:hypothetical protein
MREAFKQEIKRIRDMLATPEPHWRKHRSASSMYGLNISLYERNREFFRWQFQSLDILYTWTVETHECLNRPMVGNDLEVVITPTLIHHPFLARVCAGIRHIFGYRSRYGDFDSFEWTPDQTNKLTAMVQNIKFNAGE